MTLLILSFAAVFVAILISVGVAWNFLEAQRKKKVVGMLETVAGDKTITETTVLKDAAGEAKDFLNNLVSQFDLASKLQARMQQAGMDWSVGKLFMIMAVVSLVGAAIGIRFNPLIFPALSVAALML